MFAWVSISTKCFTRISNVSDSWNEWNIMEYQQTREVDKKLCNNLMWRNRHIRTYGPDKKKTKLMASFAPLNELFGPLERNFDANGPS